MSERGTPAPVADSPRVLVPPPLIYLGLVALAIQLEPEAGWSFAGFLGGGTRSALGVALLAPGLLLDLWALALFLRARTSALPFQPATAMVARGPYRLTRNPMYLGLTLSVLGAALLMDRPAIALGGLAAALVVDRLVIPREERYLEARFGAMYLDFKRRVRRWI